jgi:spermidine synthase
LGSPGIEDTRLSTTWLRRFARTTPDVILTDSEPFAYAAQNLYAALSAAYAAAASAFLSGGIETREMHARYQDSLARAFVEKANKIRRRSRV